MSAAMPLTNYISQSSSGNSSFRTIVAQFGDGYSQRAADGINTKEEAWSVVWENITEAQLTTLRSTFDSVEGYDYLTWTAPGDSTEKKWRISGAINISAASGDYYSVSAQITRVYDL